MSQLHQIIGTVLRDIAQARVTSDIFSRDISKYYERDSLLRLFPIPRVEVSQVEIDLNFAINKIELDPTRKEEERVSIEGLFDKYSEVIVNSVFRELVNIVNSDEEKSKRWLQLKQSWDVEKVSRDISIAINRYLNDNVKELIDKKILTSSTTNTKSKQKDKPTTETELVFNISKAGKGIADIANRLLFNVKEFTDIMGLSDMDRARAGIAFKNALESLMADIGLIRTEAYRMDVNITLGELEALPPELVSSIKITSELRNYVWSQVEQKEGENIRRLIPE